MPEIDLMDLSTSDGICLVCWPNDCPTNGMHSIAEAEAYLENTKLVSDSSLLFNGQGTEFDSLLELDDDEVDPT